MKGTRFLTRAPHHLEERRCLTVTRAPRHLEGRRCLTVTRAPRHLEGRRCLTPPPTVKQGSLSHASSSSKIETSYSWPYRDGRNSGDIECQLSIFTQEEAICPTRSSPIEMPAVSTARIYAHS